MARKVYIVMDGDQICGVYSKGSAAADCVDANPELRVIMEQPVQNEYDETIDEFLSDEEVVNYSSTKTKTFSRVDEVVDEDEEEEEEDEDEDEEMEEGFHFVGDDGDDKDPYGD